MIAAKIKEVLSVYFQALLWLLLLTFSCSVEPVNFNSTCSLFWLFVPCILLLLPSRLLQLSACDSGCGPSATGGAV